MIKSVGIKYYSMDVNHTRNTAIKLLFNEFGSNGYWVWQCLISHIYEEFGYYIPLDNKDWLILFATDVCKMRVALVDEIIKGCVRRGLFDETVFNMFNVLTSKRIQENFLDATDRRKEDRVIAEEYCLVSEENYKKLKIVSILDKNVNIPPKNVDTGSQSKGNEIKGKDSKVKSKSHCGEKSPPPEKKEVETEPHWQSLVKTWFDFNQKKFSDKPSFVGADSRHLKKIVGCLKKRAEAKKIEWTEQIAVARLNGFLETAYKDKWMSENFLLPNLEKFMDKYILNQSNYANHQTTYTKVSSNIDFSGGI